MTDNFRVYAKYYNLLYSDKDYSNEIRYTIQKLKAYSPKAQTILEFGSGTGIHGLLLQKEGFAVLGLEKSPEMVNEARAKGFSSIVADICRFELNAHYDAVIALFHVISYLTDNKDLIDTFKNAANHLNVGGIFLFDVWYTPAVYKLKAQPRIKRMKNKDLSVIRIAEPQIDINKNQVNVKYTILATDLQTNEVSELEEMHPMRHFSIPEIELLAEIAGFKLLKAEEFLSGQEPSELSWGVCFILKKEH